MKINFLDFWGDGFQSDNNFFMHLFRETFGDVELAPPHECDVVIYSCFSGSHQAVPRTVTKIFYTGENIRPNYEECDYSITFDFDTYGGKNIRLPLWMLQIDWFGHGGYGNPEYVIPLDSLVDNEFTQKEKSKFCGFVFNNPTDSRLKAIEVLGRYKRVDCYGTLFGNWFYGEKKKYNILSDYKFSICFENSTHDGYYTEKLLHAKLAGTIPIYWTDKNAGRDFNVKSFLNLTDFDTMEDLMEKVKEIDQDEDLYNSMRNEPLFTKTPNLENIKTELKKILQ